MNYRCRVPALLRTIGIFAGLALAAGQVASAEPNASRSEETAPNTLQGKFSTVTKGGALFTIYEGGPEGEFNADAARANPCTLGENNSYDRPVGTAPYGTLGFGLFNLNRFLVADDFNISSAASLNSLCWRMTLGSNDCTVNTTLQGKYTIKVYNSDGTFPVGAPLRTWVNQSPAMGEDTFTATVGTTGDPTGFTGSAIEVAVSATLSNPLALSADTCYYIEWYWDGGVNGCNPSMTLSYENDEGNLRCLSRNDLTDPNYLAENILNVDLAISLGFTPATVLGDSNSPDGCLLRFPEDSDQLATAPSIGCNQQLDFDNTYATFTPIVPTFAREFDCRQDAVDPTEYLTGDVWFKLANPSLPTATVTLCFTNQSGGQAGGNSLLRVFRLTNPAGAVDITNFTAIACNDNLCGALSRVDLTGLVSTQNYYIRVAANTPLSVGKFNLQVLCPTQTVQNDLCSSAIFVPRTGGGGGYADALGIKLTGDTSNANVDANVFASCIGFANTSGGVWYRLTGAGNRVRVTTNESETAATFDTVLQVYCGTCPAMGNPTLSCIAANDDFDLAATSTLISSEVQFCATAGRDYYILVTGFGASVGPFGVRFAEVRDGSPSAPVPCCDPQDCGLSCEYVAPANGVQENGFTGPNNGALVESFESCDDVLPQNNTSSRNNGCFPPTPPTGEERRYGSIAVGQIRTGTTWLQGAVFDSDNFNFTLAANVRHVMHLDFQAEFPAFLAMISYTANFNACSGLVAPLQLRPVNCGREVFGVRWEVDAVGGTNANATTPGTTGGFLIWNDAEAGYPCGTNSRYWLRLNELFPVTNCAGVTLPAPGTFDEEATVANVDPVDPLGTPGENCNDAVPANNRLKNGCTSVNAPTYPNRFFLRLTPGRPMFGKADASTGGGGGTSGRDIEWYKIDIAQRSVVTISVQSPLVFFFGLQENDCNPGEDEDYAAAATQGTCAFNSASADGINILNAGTYIVVGGSSDLLAPVGYNMFGNVRCAEPISEYLLTVNVLPLPTCTTICPPTPEVTEVEACDEVPPTPNLFPIFDACNPDNDGCSESVFGAVNITPSSNPANRTDICGDLFSVQVPVPRDTISIDIDYYQFTVAPGTRAKLTYAAKADMPVTVLVADTGAPTGTPGSRDRLGGSLCYNDDVPVRVLDAIETFNQTESVGDRCDAAEEVVYLTAGTYSLIVQPGTLDQGVMAGLFNCAGNLTNVGRISYSVSVLLETVGACCSVTGSCTQTTQADCTGTWTASAACGNGYVQVADATAYASIVGAPGAVQVTGLTDDNFVASSIGASFPFYGVSYAPSSVRISSNGYIFFVGNDETPVVRAFPNTASPNAIIAPFWHDWQANATGSQVWVQTSGSPPNETTIIEWSNLGRHENFNQKASFQIHLLRGGANAGAILFVYGPTANLAKLDLADVSSGVEDAAGLSGFGVTVDNAFRTGNRALRLNPTNAGGPCTPPFTCCPGDANGNRTVNFADITSVLNNFNTVYGYAPNAGQSAGDSNCNAVVNFADITSTLNNFNVVCNP